MTPCVRGEEDQVADCFGAYARKFNAPICSAVEVKNVMRNTGKPGFVVETSAETIQANCVVATGPFQSPAILPIASDDVCLVQIHSSDYRNPGATR